MTRIADLREEVQYLEVQLRQSREKLHRALIAMQSLQVGDCVRITMPVWSAKSGRYKIAYGKVKKISMSDLSDDVIVRFAKQTKKGWHPVFEVYAERGSSIEKIAEQDVPALKESK